jgi:hypothetical protein
MVSRCGGAGADAGGGPEACCVATAAMYAFACCVAMAAA